MADHGINPQTKNEENNIYGVLLYYKYTSIPDLEDLFHFYNSNCASLSLLGRVRLSSQGVNVTVGGRLSALEKHIEAVKSNALFEGTDFKLASNDQVAKECGFTSLSIRIVKKILFSTEMEVCGDAIEHEFGTGEEVEVSIDDEGFEGAWFAATVVKIMNGGKYVIEYQNLMSDDDDKELLREEVDGVQMRPNPPDIGLVDRFDPEEQVDAWYNDAWWVGTIFKLLKNDRYTVYFANTDEELKFDHCKLRVHHDWKNGKWHIP